jgi:hypothetical protein
MVKSTRPRRSAAEKTFAREFAQACGRGRWMEKYAPLARTASYDARTGQMKVELTNGCTFIVPARQLQGFADAKDADLAKVQISPMGYGLHWPTLDADFTVPGLLMGRFGSDLWMAKEMARRAGAATSPAKAAATRRNGRKGGRPPGTRSKRAA